MSSKCFLKNSLKFFLGQIVLVLWENHQRDLLLREVTLLGNEYDYSIVTLKSLTALSGNKKAILCGTQSCIALLRICFSERKIAKTGKSMLDYDNSWWHLYIFPFSACATTVRSWIQIRWKICLQRTFNTCIMDNNAFQIQTSVFNIKLEVPYKRMTFPYFFLSIIQNHSNVCQVSGFQTTGISMTVGSQGTRMGRIGSGFYMTIK